MFDIRDKKAICKLVQNLLIAVLVLVAGTLSVFAQSHPHGDVNLDDTVNIKDATMVQKYLASLIALDEEELLLAEVDGAEGVNIKDATHLQKWVVGLVDELYAPEIEQETTCDPDKPIELPFVPVL